MADAHLDALRSSAARLRDLALRMSDADLTRPAYPTEWSIADVLSHIGSGAVLMQRRLDDALAGRDTPDDVAPGVWDTWNAKTPAAKRDGALAADGELLARLEALTGDERARFSMSMGPMSFDITGFVGLRLNEHVFHTWDIEVVTDPTAVLPAGVAGVVIDNLELVARFTARPTGDPATIVVRTTAPKRHFTVDLAPEHATLSPATSPSAVDLELPAEAFARLVYGRLDPDHTPSVQGDAGLLGVLRRTFPGP